MLEILYKRLIPLTSSASTCYSNYYYFVTNKGGEGILVALQVCTLQFLKVLLHPLLLLPWIIQKVVLSGLGCNCKLLQSLAQENKATTAAVVIAEHHQHYSLTQHSPPTTFTHMSHSSSTPTSLHSPPHALHPLSI